jgi:CheY-like chemotaxis protein
MANRYRILVLEDDQALAEAIAASMEVGGHDARAEVVTSKTKLEDVVARAREWKPDAILLDHQMPVDGTAFLAGFLADPEVRNTPILLFTGATDVPVEVKRLVSMTVRKPFQMAGLVSMVENAVGMRQRASAARS